MKCREFVEFLMAYLDGDLAEETRSLFDEHMRECPSCVSYLETYSETIRLGRLACDDDAAPLDAPEDLVAAILAARRSR